MIVGPRAFKPLAIIVSPLAMIVGLRRCCFAMIVSPTRFVFASPRHTVCKPLQLEVLAEELKGENRLQVAVHVLKACRLYGAEVRTGSTDAEEIVVAEKERVKKRKQRGVLCQHVVQRVPLKRTSLIARLFTPFLSMTIFCRLASCVQEVECTTLQRLFYGYRP